MFYRAVSKLAALLSPNGKILPLHQHFVLPNAVLAVFVTEICSERQKKSLSSVILLLKNGALTISNQLTQLIQLITTAVTRPLGMEVRVAKRISVIQHLLLLLFHPNRVPDAHQ